MTGTYGSQSMVARLRRVLVRMPDESFGSASPDRWHYTGQPSLADAQTEHRAIIQACKRGQADDAARIIFTHVTSVGRAIVEDVRQQEEVTQSNE